jgi:hypothetical protein
MREDSLLENVLAEVECVEIYRIGSDRFSTIRVRSGLFKRILNLLKVKSTLFESRRCMFYHSGLIVEAVLTNTACLLNSIFLESSHRMCAP